jgi:hypothetical protein
MQAAKTILPAIAWPWNILLTRECDRNPRRQPKFLRNEHAPDRRLPRQRIRERRFLRENGTGALAFRFDNNAPKAVVATSVPRGP